MCRLQFQFLPASDIHYHIHNLTHTRPFTDSAHQQIRCQFVASLFRISSVHQLAIIVLESFSSNLFNSTELLDSKMCFPSSHGLLQHKLKFNDFCADFHLYLFGEFPIEIVHMSSCHSSINPEWNHQETPRCPSCN